MKLIIALLLLAFCLSACGANRYLVDKRGCEPMGEDFLGNCTKVYKVK